MARFTRELVLALGQRSDLELVVVVSPKARSLLDVLHAPNITEVIEARGERQIERAFWERYRLGGILERRGVDVIHGTKHLVPRTRLPTVLTVHDVMTITWPQQFTLAKRLLLPHQFRASLRAATVLIAVSNATAERLRDLDASFRVKTLVAQNGLSTELQSVTARPPAVVPTRRFALVVGDLSPRKNVSFLIDIWDRVASATDGLQLVAVGPDGWRSTPTRRRLEDLAKRGSALWARHVSDQQLRWYYEHATVVLAPTLEEGFGLPVAEALALGASVIASTDKALVEVAQGHALHLPPDDAKAWIDAIVALNTRTARLQPPPAFATWTEHAARTVEGYRRALDLHRSG